MEQLFVVRHGDYDSSTRNLSTKGRNQIITNLAPQIRGLIRYDRKPLPTIAILSSTAPRAMQTAEIIRNEIDSFKINGYNELDTYLGIALSPYLWSANDAVNKSETYYIQRDCEKITSILENSRNLTAIYPDGQQTFNARLSDYTVVVIVSHLEVVDAFPLFFIENILGRNIDTSPIRKITNDSSFKKGEGVYIDILNKEFKILKDIDIVLEAKLELLHQLLVPSGIPTQIPQVLSAYHQAFETFRHSVKDCTDCFSDEYVKALREFRDILLAGM
ncbi:MAG: hypothetical protein WCL18_07685 [bacterium]